MSNKLNSNYNHVLDDLQDYILDNKKIISCLKLKNMNINEREKNVVAKKTNIKINTNKEQFIFYPKQKDTLFWCFYIMKNGMEKYEELENINIILEKKLKIEYIELLRKEKKFIKSHKIMPLSKIEDYLLNEEKIDLNTFLALCVIERINLIYIHKKTYYEVNFLEEDDEKANKNECAKNIHVVIKNDETVKYGYIVNISNDKINDYKDKYYRLDNISKPIKAITAYKLDDLIELSNKLEIDTTNTLTNKKKNKKELYESIVQYF